MQKKILVIFSLLVAFILFIAGCQDTVGSRVGGRGSANLGLQPNGDYICDNGAILYGGSYSRDNIGQECDLATGGLKVQARAEGASSGNRYDSGVRTCTVEDQAERKLVKEGDYVGIVEPSGKYTCYIVEACRNADQYLLDMALSNNQNTVASTILKEITPPRGKTADQVCGERSNYKSPVLLSPVSGVSFIQ